MEFVDKYHFKNYIRKIISSIQTVDGTELGNDFFEDKYSDHYFELYETVTSHDGFIKDLGINSILGYVIKPLRKLDKNDTNSIFRFLDEFKRSETLLNQLKFIIEKYEGKIKYDDRKNLFNYLNVEDAKKVRILKDIVELDKYNKINVGNLVPSNQFKKLVDSIEGQYGIYFLYSSDKELLYIGKSNNLGNRVISSIWEKQIDGFIAIATTKTKSDIHVYEPYYIVTERPRLNQEFNEFEELSIELPPLKRTELVKIYDEID